MKALRPSSVALAIVFMALGMILMSACSVTPVAAPEEPAPAAPAVDDDALTKDYVERAMAYLQANGLEQAVEFYSSGQSIEGERYLILVDAETRVLLAIPGREWLIGYEIPAGGSLAGVIAAATEEGAWVEALSVNPRSGKTEPARYFATLRDGLLFLSLHFILRENVEETTKEYVAKAIARYESEGLDSTVAYYNSRESLDGQFYLFMMDENDIYLVHPIFPHLIGTDIKDVVGSDGQELGKEIAQATEDGHWIEYLWPNPLTGNEESKVTWAVRHDGRIFASGYYTSSEEDVTPAWANADPRDYTVAYVNRAIERYDRDGLDSLKAYYNSVASFEGQWYMFIMDENDIYIIHPLLPRLIGTDIKDVVGSDGYELGKEIAKATEEGHWIEYLWPHPVTLREAPKVGYAVRHDGMIFASGYYPLPADVREQVEAYVQRALERYERDGLEATVAHYNDPDSVEGEVYLVIYSQDNIVLTNAIVPHLVGADMTGATTLGGVNLEELLRNAASEDGAWVQYASELRNVRGPGFGQRHQWVVLRDGLLFTASYSQ